MHEHDEAAAGRREFLKKAGLVAGAAVWATPAIQVVNMAGAAARGGSHADGSHVGTIPPHECVWQKLEVDFRCPAGEDRRMEKDGVLLAVGNWTTNDHGKHDGFDWKVDGVRGVGGAILLGRYPLPFFREAGSGSVHLDVRRAGITGVKVKYLLIRNCIH